jgi:hypothetical protein
VYLDMISKALAGVDMDVRDGSGGGVRSFERHVPRIDEWVSG